MSSATDIDIAIIGGGIMGLWTAFSLLQTYPQAQVALFEKEMYLGEHTTSRNSEVLHAGIYYETGSLKHIHCLRGNQLWRQFMQKAEIPFLDCGKYIVAQKDEREALEAIHQKALRNQVPGMRPATREEVEILRPFIRADEALYSPTSAVLDVSTSLKRLRFEIESREGLLFLKSQVILEDFTDYFFKFQVNGEVITSKFLLNLAGLHAIEFREQLQLFDFKNYYVKGNYLQLSGEYPAQNLIYPIPPAHGLGLGVHLTLDVQGKAKFGPNTLPVDSIQYQVEEETLTQMSAEILRLFYTVDPRRLQLGYAGVRPKVKKQDILLKDFVIQDQAQHRIKGYVEALGIESPGLTAAPSLAEELVRRISL